MNFLAKMRQLISNTPAIYNIMILWFYISIYLVWYDPSIPDIISKLQWEMINVLSIFWLAQTRDKKTDNALYLGLTIMLISWYGLSTIRDALEPSYQPLLKLLYVGVDTIMLCLFFNEFLHEVKQKTCQVAGLLFAPIYPTICKNKE